jgi:hypothetical protein
MHLGASLPEEEHDDYFWANYKNVDDNISFTAPKEFNARVQWPECAKSHPIRNQGKCGSCWAHGTTEAVSFRACTLNKDQTIVMAPQHIVSCDHDIGISGCNGANTGAAYKFITAKGLVDDKCYPYTSGTTG